MAKLLDDLMRKVDSNWEPTEKSKETLINISARLPQSYVAMVDALTCANLADNRTESLKLIIEAGFEFLNDRVPVNFDDVLDEVYKDYALDEMERGLKLERGGKL